MLKVFYILVGLREFIFKMEKLSIMLLSIFVDFYVYLLLKLINLAQYASFQLFLVLFTRPYFFTQILHN
jgi:hypothetical protein